MSPRPAIPPPGRLGGRKHGKASCDKAPEHADTHSLGPDTQVWQSSLGPAVDAGVRCARAARRPVAERSAILERIANAGPARALGGMNGFAPPVARAIGIPLKAYTPRRRDLAACRYGSRRTSMPPRWRPCPPGCQTTSGPRLKDRRSNVGSSSHPPCGASYLNYYVRRCSPPPPSPRRGQVKRLSK